MKKTIVGRLAVVVLIMALGWTVGVGATEMRLTYNPLPFNAPSMVERELELLKEQGVSAEYIQLSAGYSMTEAMAAGQLDLAPVMGGTSAIVSAAGGRDIQILQVYSRAPRAFALVTRPGHMDLGDLVGSTIGLPVGTEAHYLLARVLEEQGIALHEVQIANLLVPDAVAALQAGQIDAAVVVDPVLSRLRQAGQVEVLRDGEGLIAGVTLSVVHGPFADQASVQGFLTAHLEALAWMEANPDALRQLAADETNLPEGLIDQLLNTYTFDPNIDEGIMEDLQRAADFLFSAGIIRQAIDVADWLWLP